VTAKPERPTAAFVNARTPQALPPTLQQVRDHSPAYFNPIQGSTMQYKNTAATLIALTIGLGAAGSALAEAMTQVQYQTEKTQIGHDYKTAKTACVLLAGNAKDVCKEEAKGSAKRAHAELEARYEPSAKKDRKVLEVKAETEYDVAKEKCHAQDGHAKDACVKEAKALETAAKAAIAK
jgi:hypothetical protein